MLVAALRIILDSMQRLERQELDSAGGRGPHTTRVFEWHSTPKMDDIHEEAVEPLVVTVS